MTENHEEQQNLNRWRLILGKNSENHIDFSGSYSENISYEDMENTLDFLYSMEFGDELMKLGGNGGSRLYTADWIAKVRKIFPKKTVEVLEKQALEHFNLTELLTDKEVLQKMEPNTELLKTILQFKHMMENDVIAEAKRIVKTVVDEISEKLQQDIQKSLLGKLNRNMPSNIKSMRNLDFKRTIQRNLKNYDSKNKQIVLKNVYFNSRTKRFNNCR